MRASLRQAVQADDEGRQRTALPKTLRLVIRSTHLDFVFILLYWLTFLSLAYLAGILGKRFFAACCAIFISCAVLADMLENQRHPVGHAGSSIYGRSWQWISPSSPSGNGRSSSWRVLFLGLAIALNHRIVAIRRISGGVFIAAGLCGILGLSRHRVSLDFPIWMITFGIFLVSAALLLSLWKFYQSLKELNQLDQAAYQSGITRDGSRDETSSRRHLEPRQDPRPGRRGRRTRHRDRYAAGLRCPPSVVEDGLTFEANASKKAEHYSHYSDGELVIADDSGLEVDALHGAPGVRSARYAADEHKP